MGHNVSQFLTTGNLEVSHQSSGENNNQQGRDVTDPSNNSVMCLAEDQATQAAAAVEDVLRLP